MSDLNVLLYAFFIVGNQFLLATNINQRDWGWSAVNFINVMFFFVLLIIAIKERE